jgi:hypothetical protein
MTNKPTKNPKLTDAERHKRFVEMAEKVGASDNPEDFDAVFDRVVASSRKKPPEVKNRVPPKD